VNDTNANGAEEIATFGTSTGGVNLWQLHDRASGALTNTIALPNDFTPVRRF